MERARERAGSACVHTWVVRVRVSVVCVHVAVGCTEKKPTTEVGNACFFMRCVSPAIDERTLAARAGRVAVSDIGAVLGACLGTGLLATAPLWYVSRKKTLTFSKTGKSSCNQTPV